MWYATIRAKLERSRLFQQVEILLGWDDYPHEHIAEIRRLASYPHHFQRRQGSTWAFEESPMRGDVEREIPLVIKYIRAYLRKQRAWGR